MLSLRRVPSFDCDVAFAVEPERSVGNVAGSDAQNPIVDDHHLGMHKNGPSLRTMRCIDSEAPVPIVREQAADEGVSRRVHRRPVEHVRGMLACDHHDLRTVGLGETALQCPTNHGRREILVFEVEEPSRGCDTRQVELLHLTDFSFAAPG